MGRETQQNQSELELIISRSYLKNVYYNQGISYPQIPPEGGKIFSLNSLNLILFLNELKIINKEMFDR